MPKPKAKTFWVWRGDSAYWLSPSEYDVVAYGCRITIADGVKMFGSIKRFKSKQFKIVEVKHGTKK